MYRASEPTQRVLAGIIGVVATAVALTGCTPGPTDEEIREAVLLTAHASGAVITRSLSANSPPFEGASYDRESGTIDLDNLDTEPFRLRSEYTAVSGSIQMGGSEIEDAVVDLEGGAVEHLEFGFEDGDPLAGEWTVEGIADGHRFQMTLTSDQVRQFRKRE
jgi:hypothetical protein